MFVISQSEKKCSIKIVSCCCDCDSFRKYQMDSENVEEELRKLEELAKDSAVGETMYDKKSVIEKILERPAL